MLFCLDDLRFKYELEKLARTVLPFEKFTFTENEQDLHEGVQYIKILSKTSLITEINVDGKLETRKRPKTTEVFDENELQLALMLFDCIYAVSGYRSPWGILTGIRPAKLIGKLIAADGLKAAVDCFKNTFLVSDDKIRLCLECNRSERAIVERSAPNSFSLYISVPFCPSRCNYCSFVSHSVEQAKRLIPKYTELLCREIRETAKIAKSLNLKLKTIYIGGGTPTTLSAEQLTQVLDTVKGSFDFSDLEEYTVEAGRPDTVTKEKLLAIKSGGATRISINPQTMNDEVLKNIGRRHTVAEMIDAFHLARECGFDNINTDLIAGLSGDTFESFCHSVDEIIALDPENVTVHTLSMKRASNLTKSQTVFDLKEGETAAKMVDYARMKLIEHGVKPYYMYRQSKTVGNLENVGYAKQGYEGLYNVYIMDETHTILACGASAVIKLREIGGDNIERIFNYKYPYEYIEKFNDIIDRKQKILEFYKGILTV